MFSKLRQPVCVALSIILIASIVLTPVSSSPWYLRSTFAQELDNVTSAVSSNATSSVTTNSTLVKLLINGTSVIVPVNATSFVPINATFVMVLVNGTFITLPVNDTSFVTTNATATAPTNSTLVKLLINGTSVIVPVNATSFIPINDTFVKVLVNGTFITLPINATSFVTTNATAAVPTNATAAVPTNATAAVPTNATAAVTTNATSQESIPAVPVPNVSFTLDNQTISEFSLHGSVVTTNETNQNSLQLAKTGDYVQLATEGTISRELSSLTVSAWVKPDYSSGSAEFTVISKPNAFLLTINNNIYPYKVAKFSVFDGIIWQTVESESTIPEEWTHLAATFDGQKINIYVNGKLEGSEELIAPFTISITGQVTQKSIGSIISDSDVYIGTDINSRAGSPDILKDQYAGLIADVQISEAVLDASQIKAIYDNGVKTPSEVSEVTTNATSEVTTNATSEVTTNATSEVTTNATSEVTTNATSEVTTNATFALPANAAVKTGSAKYSPGQSAKIIGSGLQPGVSYVVMVIRSDGYVVKSDGTDGSDTVTTGEDGSFVYLYKLSSIDGDYTVQVFDSRDPDPQRVLTTTFTNVAPAIKNDKSDYEPHDTVKITGDTFTPDSSYDIVIERPDGSIVKGDGTFAAGFDTIQADSNGNFVYSYKLDGIKGLYKVAVYSSLDTSHTIVLAKTGFADAPTSAGPNIDNAGGTTWTNSGNAYDTDLTNCATTLAKSTKLYLNDLQFSIPSTAIITGVVVTPKSAISTSSTMKAHLATGPSTVLGSGASSTKSFTPVTASCSGTTEQNLGTGTTDIWGTTNSGSNPTLTPAVVNDASFGVLIDSGGGATTITRSLNYVKITIYYDTAPTSTISSPADNSYSTSTTVALSGTSSDANLQKTEISVDGGAFVATSGTAASWTYSATALSQASHTFQTKATDLAGNTGLSAIIHVTVDTTAPTITLTGANPQVIELGAAYTELGATVSDNQVAAITATIDATAVNTAAVGSYTVKYDATDAAGNAATQKTRTVTVQDTTKPLITLKGNTPLTLSLNSIYTDAGATALDNYDGDITQNIQVANPVNTNLAGTYTVTYSVSDSSGNAAVQLTRTVNVVNVDANSAKIELTAPSNELPPISIVGKDNSAAIQSAVTEQSATQLDNTISSQTKGSEIMATLAMQQYTMPGSNDVVAIIPPVATKADPIFGQLVSTPPLNTIVPGQEMIIPANSIALPEFGGVKLLHIKSSATPTENGSPTQEWLVVSVNDKVPSGSNIPALADNGIDGRLSLFIQVKYPYAESKSGFNWGNPLNFATLPTMTLVIPKPTADAGVQTDTSGCQLSDVFILDETISPPSWTSNGVSVISTTESAPGASTCDMLVQTPHFSNFTVAGIPVALPLTHGGENPSSPPSVSSLSVSTPQTREGQQGFGARLDLDPNKVYTNVIETGDPTKLRLRLSDESGTSVIEHVALYMNLGGILREVGNSDTDIIWDKNTPLQVADPNGFFTNADAKTSTIGRNLQLTLDFTFKKPMDKSDIIIRTWDQSKNSHDIRYQDAIQIVKPQTISGTQIPVWVKNNAEWWSQGKIGDSDFVQGIQYLIKNDIIKVSVSKAGEVTATQIPAWVKSNAEWWSQGLITENDFVTALQWLISNGIITLENQQ